MSAGESVKVLTILAPYLIKAERIYPPQNQRQLGSVVVVLLVPTSPGDVYVGTASKFRARFEVLQDTERVKVGLYKLEPCLAITFRKTVKSLSSTTVL